MDTAVSLVRTYLQLNGYFSDNVTTEVWPCREARGRCSLSARSVIVRVDRGKIVSLREGLVDTMWDLMVDAAGAFVIAILGYGYLQTAEVDSFLEEWIVRFIDGNPRLFRK